VYICAINQTLKHKAMTNTIQPGTTITATFIGDSNLKMTAQVLLRKGDFVTCLCDKQIIRKKVKVAFDGSEYVMLLGSYSMAPMFY